MASYPYTAKAIMKYKTPHDTDLSFAKDEEIRVTGQADEDEDWLIGESVDGSRQGGFPKAFVTPLELASAPAAPEIATSAQNVPSKVEPSAPVAHTATTEEVAISDPLNSSAANQLGSPDVATAPTIPLASTPRQAEAKPADSTSPPTIIAAPSTPQPSQSAAPPPSAASPSDEPSKTSFKDRLAAFNKGTKPGGSTPPPPLKPKPAGGQGTWAWKQKQAQAQAQPQSEVPSAGPGVTSTTGLADSAPLASTTSRDEAQGESGAGGMSASDAKDSITKGMSMKERMAALAGAGAFGGGDKEKKAPPPVGGKPKVWKRPEALVAPASEEVTGPTMGMPQPVRKWSIPAAELGEGETGQTGMQDLTAAEAGEGEEDEEAQKEKERRAAIAARMQRLGGRGIMGGPPPTAPKPARKPTAEVVPTTQASEEVPAPPASETLVATLEQAPPPVDVPPVASEPPIPAQSAPNTDTGSGIILPAIPRRAGPPKRRTRAAGFGATSTPTVPSMDDGRSANPPVPGDDSELPLPKTEASLARETELENVGQGSRGGDGAQAAGIAVEDVSGGDNAQAKDTPAAPALRATPSFGDRSRAIPDAPHDVGDTGEERLKDVFGSDDQDAPPPPPRPVAFVPLSDEPSAPIIARSHPTGPTPGGITLAGLPKDEIELKHEAEQEPDWDEEEGQATEDEDDRGGITEDNGEDDDDAPPPPPARSLPVPASPARPAEHPAGPRPMPTTPVSVLPGPNREEPGRLQPPEEDRALDDVVAAAPLLRQPSIGSQAKIGLPASGQSDDNPDAEATRRQGIAARMAKLGGIKLGGPPLTRNRSSFGVSSPGGTGQDQLASPMSPTVEKSLPPAPQDAVTETPDEDDETEEAAARRRQATFARLRAGGSLGYGMFNNAHGSVRPGGEQEQSVPSIPSQDAEAPIPPPSRSMPTPTPTSTVLRTSQLDNVDDDEGDDTLVREDDAGDEAEEAEEEAPPPVPSRLSMDAPRRSTSTHSIPFVPSSPHVQRSGSVTSRRSIGLAPPLPAVVTDLSQSASYVSSPVNTTHDTLPEGDEDNDAPPPPPVSRPPAQPARSGSLASRASRQSFQSRRSIDVPPQSPSRTQSMSAGTGRPGYAELQQAATVYGAKVLRVAHALGGGRASIGDGSSRALVWQAMSDAGLDANKTFGTLVLEQDSQSVQQRYDEPRPGDVIILHDCKLSGKKLLKAYSQSFGSVQEPLFGVCTEYEGKKNKLSVLTILKGHPATESLRLEDLKTGLIRVFRPMP